MRARAYEQLMIGSCLSPLSLPHRTWSRMVCVVCLYLWLAVPVRLAFLPYTTFTDRGALVTDAPADVLLVLHVVVLLNTAVKAEGRSGWISDRFKIFQQTDFIVLFAAIPLDWLGFACGISNEACCWLRLNKLFVYLSRSSPRHVVFSKQHVPWARVANLFVTMFFFLHMLACAFFWLGRAQPYFDAGPSVSWLFVDPEFQDMTYDREEHFATKASATTAQRYLFSLYWVAATITVNGAVGDFIPQNIAELIFTTLLMALNMTLYRWIMGEVSSIIMSSDDDVVKARAELESVTSFASGKNFSPELRDEIRSHFAALNAGSSVDQDKLFHNLSHGLRVELASFISRDFLTKIELFFDCSEQYLDTVCVLLREVNFIPEETIFLAGDVCREMFFVLNGAVHEVEGDEGDKVVKVCRRNEAVGPLAFFFGLRQFFTARASRQGAICMRLSREALFDVLKKYPEDEEVLLRNAFKTFHSTGAATIAKSSRSRGSGAGGDAKSKSSQSSKGSKTKSKSSKSSKSSVSARKPGKSGASEGGRTFCCPFAPCRAESKVARSCVALCPGGVGSQMR